MATLLCLPGWLPDARHGRRQGRRLDSKAATIFCVTSSLIWLWLGIVGCSSDAPVVYS